MIQLQKYLSSSFLKTFGAAAAMLAFVGASGTAWASDEYRCTSEPRSKWLSLDVISQKAKDLGYSVTKIEADDGCWEVKGYDKNGARIELDIHPITGEPFSTEKQRR